MRSLDLILSVAARIAVAEVISEYENDIGAQGLFRAMGRQYGTGQKTDCQKTREHGVSLPLDRAGGNLRLVQDNDALDHLCLLVRRCLCA